MPMDAEAISKKDKKKGSNSNNSENTGYSEKISHKEIVINGEGEPDGETKTVSPSSKNNSSDSVQIPLVRDSLTFEDRQNLRLLEIEKRLHDELKRKSRDWDKDVEHMRQEFLELYPVNKDSKRGANDLGCNGENPKDSLVATRRGSTDVLDTKKMKTLFLEYPDSGRRCKLRFNVAEFDPSDIAVTTDGERIIVTASRVEKDAEGQTYHMEYQRKIERPKEVDHAKLKSFLTTDGILIVEAPLPPDTLNLRRKTSSNSPSRSSSAGKRASVASLKSKSSSTRSPTMAGNEKPRASDPSRVDTTGCSQEVGESPGCGKKSGIQKDCITASNSSAQLSKEKFGVPILREDNGRRKVMLTLDMGQTFAPKEICVQIIKENRIQVKARHEERTSDRLLKNKFSKDYELPEKIETYSLRGGLTPDGKLLMGALIKGHATGLNKVSAGELLTEDLNSRAENQPCNILDLSTFPPTTPAIILASASWANSQAQ